jgi:hypothetical protein
MVQRMWYQNTHNGPLLTIPEWHHRMHELDTHGIKPCHVTRQDIPEFLWEYALLHVVYVGIGHSLPIWETSPPSKDGSYTTMCQTFESSVHLFGSFYKAKRETEKFYQSPNDMYVLALMMALKQLSITVPKCIKY